MRPPSSHSLDALIGLLVALLSLSGTPRALASSPDYAPAILGVVINNRDQGFATAALRHGADILVDADDLKSWRIVLASAPTLTRDGIDYYALSALTPLTFKLDERAQVLHLHVPVESFEVTAISSGTPETPPISDQVFSAFLNYDLTASWTETNEGISGIAEFGTSDDWGAISTSVLGQATEEDNDLVRLDTYYLRDDPENMTRLSVGDGITRSAVWSTPVRFGGVQFGTNFGLQPSFVSFPTPDFSGSAALPSVVEVYVNDALRQRADVDEGPFTLNQVPVVTGGGDVRFVVTDELGVERSVVAPYYVSTQLLTPGLMDYSVELGVERASYGDKSFDYDDPFASGTLRYGITDWLTTEVHGEASADSATAGGGFTWVINDIGEFGAFGAASEGDGLGALGRVSFSRVQDWWSIGLSYQRSTEDFIQIGIDPDDTRVEDQLQASAGISMGDYGSFTLAYTQLDYSDDTDATVTSATYSAAIFDWAYFNAFALRSESTFSDPSLTIGAMVTIPIGERSNASVQIEDRDGRPNALAQFRQDAPPDEGFGYRVAVSRGDIDEENADLTWRTNVGVFTAQAAEREGEASARLLASGGIAFADSSLFMSRRIESGFGLVEVPGYEGVTVYIDNRPVAETDSDGTAIIPDLRAYGDNKVSIDTTALPIDASIGNDVIHLVPGIRGAVVAKFDAKSTNGATLTVLLPDGTALPQGIPINIGGQADAAISGYDGVVFVEALSGGENVEVAWNGARCGFTIDATVPSGPLPDLGTYMCKSVGQ